MPRSFLPWLDWVADTKSMEDSLLFLEKVDKDWQDDNQFVYEKFISKIYKTERGNDTFNSS